MSESSTSANASNAAPVLVRSVPKRRYELGRSPDLAVPLFMSVGLPALTVVGALISGLISLAV